VAANSKLVAVRPSEPADFLRPSGIGRRTFVGEDIERIGVRRKRKQVSSLAPPWFAARLDQNDAISLHAIPAAAHPSSVGITDILNRKIATAAARLRASDGRASDDQTGSSTHSGPN
jgi:hypothetical protein